MAKVQQTTAQKSQEQDVKRLRPMWKVEADKIELVNAEQLTMEQLSYLKKFVGKKATDKVMNGLKAEIIKHEGELVKKSTPKVQAEPKLTAEQVKEATKGSKEVAPTTDSKKTKVKSDGKVKQSVEKPKAQPKSKKAGSKVLDLYDSNAVYDEGQLVDCSYAEGIKFKIASPDAKPKLGQWAFVPKFKGVNEKGEDLFMRINYIGKQTVWLVEPFLSENMIPIGPEALSAHFMDEIDEEGNVVPEEEWIPFYLCDMTMEQPKKVEPEVKEESEPAKKTEEKPKADAKKPKVKVKTNKPKVKTGKKTTTKKGA